jgi:hypothetical protein
MSDKPWIGNRLGDPRQLIHEAAILEHLADERRREAMRLRAIAAEEDKAAARIDEAAKDYREWAASHPVDRSMTGA